MISEQKLRRCRALANQAGIISAAAMDQRGSLKKMLGAAKRVDKSAITDEMMAEFKGAVTKVLTPHASAILLDPEYGLPAAAERSANAGLILAYELSGYDNTQPGRLPDLIPNMSAKRLVDAGADAAKVLIYYTPFQDGSINDIKHAFVERIGAECEAEGLPFYLELLGYAHDGADEKGLAYARIKPEVVTRSMEEFSKPHYRVDVLKVEVPVNTAYMEGSIAFSGQTAYSRTEALDYFRRASEASRVPFIYLSAGVSNAQFIESLNSAAEAKADYSGVLCGRATWKDGVAAYGKGGRRELEQWLEGEGVRNIEAVNKAVENAVPWMKKAGVKAA